jgi:hypothetical protein
MAPRSTLTKLTAPGNYPTLPITANSLDLPMAATVVADKTQFVASGKDLVIAQNTGATAHTVTISSVANPKDGRTGDVAAYSIDAGEIAVFGPFSREGWLQADGNIYLEANHVEIKFGVITLPQ